MSFSFFQNKTCEMFPCHSGVDGKIFNCLFCYCPLYSLGRECGGAFSYANTRGIKDCAGCTVPHIRDNYHLIVRKLDGIVAETKSTAYKEKHQ